MELKIQRYYMLLSVVEPATDPNGEPSEITVQTKCNVTAVSEHAARRKALEMAHANGARVKKFLKIVTKDSLGSL